MIKSLATSWVVVAVLAVASPAVARKMVIAPPGDSASSQYVEVVPTAGGPGVTNTGPPSSQVLSSSQTRRLDSHGAAGRALVALVNGTSPSTSSARTQPARAGAPRVAAPAPAATPAPLASVKGQSAAASVAAAAIGHGGGGLGSLLPIAIVLAVLGLVIGAIRRMRTQG